MGHMSDTTSITHGIYNIDHDVNYRQVSESAVQWFFTKFDLHDPSYLITLNLTKYDNLKCWGESFQVDDLALKRREYVISVATDQKFRDFIATLMHELVHVHQWEFHSARGLVQY